MSFEMVNISVGEPAVTIPVYKDLICSVAPYFRGAFKYAFREAEEGAIALPDVEEPIFRIFLKWCYSQSSNSHTREDCFITDELMPNEVEDQGFARAKLDKDASKTLVKCFDDFTFDGPSHLLVLTQEERAERYFENPTWIACQARIHHTLLKLYGFADKYSADQLRDDVLSVLLGHSRFVQWWPVDLELIQQAYNTLPSTSPFLRLLVLTHCYCWSPPDSAQKLAELENLPHKFLVDAAIAYSRKQQAPGKGETTENKTVPSGIAYGLANSCIFHEHLVLGKQQCRERLARCTYIFKDLLKMCIELAEIDSTNQ